MTLVELKEQLDKQKKLNHLYIFTGDETAILNEYINKITKIFKGNIKHTDSFNAIYNTFGKTNLLKSKPNCYIIYDDKEYMLRKESVWKSIIDGKILKDNVIIFVYFNLDKRSKFYKTHQNFVTTFDNLNDTLLCKYIKKKLPELDNKFAEQLVYICRNSYSRILLECDKLNHLNEALKINDINKCYEYAMSQSFIWIPPEDAIFSFVSACLSRNIDDCYYYLNECKLIGENELNILSNLYNSFRALYQVQCAGGYSKDICNVTGLQYYQVKSVLDKLKNYSLDEVLRALRLIHYCEKSIKDGTMESAMVLDFMLVNLL